MYRHLKLYKMFIGKQVKTLMIYRVDFVVGIICLLLSFATVAFSIWALFEQTNSIGGWTKYEIVFMYGYNLLISGLAWLLFNQAWGLRDSIISGAFIKYKIRPINSLFHFFGESIDFKAFGTIALGITVLMSAAATLAYEWSMGSGLALMGLAFMSALLFSGLIVLASSLGFWLTISNPLLGFIASMVGIAHFPMTIYGKAMTTFLSTLIPIAFLSYYPCAILLGKVDTINPIYTMLTITLVIWSVALWLWFEGVRRYELSGT